MTKQNIQQIKQRFGIIGISTQLERNIDIALQVATTDLSVLVTGESGTGKESFPKIIHHYSKRKHGPYFAINCGSIPEGTIDSELFGHEKGSFTGALSSRKGYFEAADNGTLFLDEVGELPIPTQARLLRVLETGEFIKVGSSKIEKTNVRVVAATNLNMIDAVQKGKFREDLYYRLSSVPIRMPSLRERKDDIYLLFRKFSSDFAEKYMMPPISLTEEAKELLSNYYWPGNIRQLKNITEQISIIEHERVIDVEILKKYLPNNEVGMSPILLSKTQEEKSFSNEREILYQVLFDMKKDISDLKNVVKDIIDNSINNKTEIKTVAEYIETPLTIDYDTQKELPQSAITIEKNNEINDSPQKSLSLTEIEKDLIKKALEKHRGKRRFAANDLGISERTLYRKIKEYRLDNI